MSPFEAADLIRAAQESLPARLSVVVDKVVEAAAENTRAIIGEQQTEFAPLAKATKEEKARAGFQAPDYEPLLRTGGYKQSIESYTVGLKGGSGSDWEGAAWQEFGTPDARNPIPPRPAIALGMMRALPVAETLLEDLAGDLLGLEAP